MDLSANCEPSNVGRPPMGFTPKEFKVPTAPRNSAGAGWMVSHWLPVGAIVTLETIPPLVWISSTLQAKALFPA